MLGWKKRASIAREEPEVTAPVARPHGRKAGKYQLLYDYLENRYADTVVLTFQQVEDLVGFALPDLARHDPEWWSLSSQADGGGASAWFLASRTAQPNLRAQTVAFERVP